MALFKTEHNHLFFQTCQPSFHRSGGEIWSKLSTIWGWFVPLFVFTIQLCELQTNNVEPPTIELFWSSRCNHTPKKNSTRPMATSPDSSEAEGDCKLLLYLLWKALCFKALKAGKHIDQHLWRHSCLETLNKLFWWDGITCITPEERKMWLRLKAVEKTGETRHENTA